jgi:PAS domain S-box-containing protein
MEMCQKAPELEEPVMHYCFVHGGHFVAPIIIDGEHKGTMFAGQCIPQKFSPEQLKALEKIAVEINVDPTLLVEEAKKMRVVEEDRVWKYSSLLFQIVAVITRLGAQADELNRAKDTLQKAHNGLEIHVQERTAELARANEELKQDITERKHLMMELDNSHKFLEAIIKNIPDAVYLKDSQYRYSLVNQAYCDLFDVKKEEIIRKERVYETDKEIFQTGKAVEIQEQSFIDHKGKCHYTHLKKVPLIDNSGNVTHVLTISRDITERKKAEEALRESNAKIRAIVETAKDSIFIKDQKLKYVMVNPAMERLFGMPAEELLGKSDTELFGEEAKQHIEEVDHRVLQGEIVDEFPFKPVGGETKTFHTIKVPLHDASGAIIGLCGIARDITEQKQIEEELRESLTKLKRFNKLAVDRELRMIELKKEINGLLEDLDKEPRYKIAGEEDKTNYEL